MSRRLVVAIVLVGAALASSVSPAGASAGPVLFPYDCSHEVREPRSVIVTCADGFNRLRNIHWSTWALSPRGVGTDFANDCIPDCANGTEHPYQARVRLARPQFCPALGIYQYTRLTLSFPHASPAPTHHLTIPFPCHASETSLVPSTTLRAPTMPEDCGTARLREVVLRIEVYGDVSCATGRVLLRRLFESQNDHNAGHAPVVLRQEDRWECAYDTAGYGGQECDDAEGARVVGLILRLRRWAQERNEREAGECGVVHVPNGDPPSATVIITAGDTRCVVARRVILDGYYRRPLPIGWRCHVGGYPKLETCKRGSVAVVAYAR